MTTTTTNTAAKTAALSYIYTDTLRKFTFYQLPKTLFEDNGYQLISNDSKLLYSMMLDRAGLSAQNGWTDSARRVFIYFKMEEAIGKLHIGHNKAVRLYKELETCGMIERKKQGLGKPDLIYVKVFASKKEAALIMEAAEEAPVRERMSAYLPVEEQVEESPKGEYVADCPERESVVTYPEEECVTPYLPALETETAEEAAVPSHETTVSLHEAEAKYGDNTDTESNAVISSPVIQSDAVLPYPPTILPFREDDFCTAHIEYPSVLTVQADDFSGVNTPAPLPKTGRRLSPLGKSGIPKSGTLDFPFWVSNNIKPKDKEMMKNQSINPPAPAYHPPNPAQYKARYDQNWIRERMEEAEDYREMIRENIDYDMLCQDYPADMELIDGYVDLMVEVCCSRRKTCRVNREEYPTAVVKSCFEKLNREHILYVKERMENNPTQIRNIRAYTLSALFNSYSTITQYYTSQVSHDMAQGSHEKLRR